jgi:receptor protein-tyrosine kinase
MIATVFGVPTTSRGFATLLEDRASAEEALVPAQGYGENLRLLLASPEHAQLVDLLDPDRVERVLTDLRLDADVVIVDSPPLTEVADALSLAAAVDAVIVAVRLGRTRRDRLNELRRMLAQRGISPLGFVVTTRNRRRGQGYYYGRSNEQEGNGETRRAPALIRSADERPEGRAKRRARAGAAASDDDF